jgi:hypothetical protein
MGDGFRVSFGDKVVGRDDIELVVGGVKYEKKGRFVGSRDEVGVLGH